MQSSHRIEQALKRAAESKGIKPGTDRYRRYVGGTLRKLREKQNSGTNVNKPE